MHLQDTSQQPTHGWDKPYQASKRHMQEKFGEMIREGADAMVEIQVIK